MVIESEDYKLEILKYAINQSIDRLLPKSCEDALNVILYQSNEVVQRVATEIYTKSGHQVDFIFIRDLLNLRIEPLRNKIAKEERIKAELEAQKRIGEAEQERTRKEKEAEQAKISAKLEVDRLAREAKQKKAREQQKEIKQKQLQEFVQASSNISVVVIDKIEGIIADQLEVDREKITMDAYLDSHLGADDLDIVELMMALEEEFDVEIPDSFTGVNWSLSSSCDRSRLKPVQVKDIINLIHEKIQCKYYQINSYLKNHNRY